MIWYIDRNEKGNLELTLPTETVRFQPAEDLPPITFTQGVFFIEFPDDDQAEMVGRMLRDEVESREWELLWEGVEDE